MKNFRIEGQEIESVVVARKPLTSGASIPVVRLGTFGSDSVPAVRIAETVRDAIGIGYRHIDRFTAVCDILKDLPQPQFSSADVWVLLDGVVCLHLRYPTGQSVIEKVDISISAQTRFLTLVTTCSGRADYSWIFFGDPFLEPVVIVQEEATL